MDSFFHFDDRIMDISRKAEADCAREFQEIDAICEHNTAKVLKAFADNRVSESHFAATTGYGYGDRGRETLDAVMAQIMGAEDCLIRHNFVSGTHAISTALFGVLRPGDRMVSVTGQPYDTLHGVIGLTEGGCGSLKDFGVEYGQLDLLADGSIDYQGLPQAVQGAKVVYFQRSRGYTLRPSLTVEELGKAIAAARKAQPSAIIVVDNCYGEFVQRLEPTQVGADLIIGSLIKNPGGGIAPTGGYIAGKSEFVEMAAHRLTAPGVGREVGCTLGHLRELYMGLFHAPSAVCGALKTAVFASRIFSGLGYRVTPTPEETRADIIQAICLERPEALIAFCQGIQKGSPIDSFVTPEPWDMPGYDSQVIMAAGAFTGGASIELSADAPLREPYAVWMQGGLTFASGKLGILLAAQAMLDSGLLPGA